MLGRTARLPLCPVGVSLCWECVLQPTYHFVQLECVLQPTYHFVQLECLCVGSASYSPLTTLSSWSASYSPLTTLSSWSVSVLGVSPTAHLPLCPVGVSLCWECVLHPTYHFVQLECLCVGSESYSQLTTLSSWSVSVLGVRPTPHLPLCPVGVSLCLECVLQPTYHFVQLECLCVRSASYSPLTTLSSWSVSVLGVRPTAHLPLCPVGVSLCWECVLQPTYHFVQLECLCVGSASYSPLTTLSSWSVSVLGVRPTAHLPLCPVGVSLCWECVLQPTYHFVQLECLCVGSASYSPLTTLSSWSVCVRSASYSPLTTLSSWSVSVLGVRPTAHLPLCPVGVSLCWECVLQPTYHFVQLECLCVRSASYSPLTTLSSWSVSVLGVRPTAHLPLCPVGVSLCWECVLHPTYHFVQLECLCVGSESYSPLTTLSSWSVSVLGVRPTAHLPLCPVGVSLCWECVLQPTYHFAQLECLCVGSASYSPLTTLSSWSVSVLGVRPTSHLPLCPVGVYLCWECILHPTYHFVQLECICVGSASYSPLTTLSSWSVSVLGVRPTSHLPLCPVGVYLCWE